MSEEVIPFSIRIEDAQLEDLKNRLANTRWPEQETPDDWSQGTPLAYMQELATYWREEYDWRAREERLNQFPQFMTEIDHLKIHFIHIRSPHPEARPLLISHGWPGSIVEFCKVLDPLVNPGAHGGQAEDAFHVVAPSLPGFGFSDKPDKPGWSIEKIADAWSLLMRRLGYDKYFAQGGDWGAMITAAIGSRDAAHCQGIHSNMPIIDLSKADMTDLTELEQGALAGMEHYRDQDSGYSKQQSTRPQTLGYGLVDSPAGQLAWIMEKFYAWTDCNGHPENILSRDELLDNVMLYWLPANGASSARIYWESFANSPLEEIHIPAGCSIFPKEIFRLSKRWAETRFKNIVHWNVLDKGGHFAAFEQPELFVEEVRACFRQVR